MGLREAWASMGKWERRSAALGGLLIMASAAMYVDTAFVRPEHYRDKWREGRDQRWAQELHHLLLPGVKPEENRPNAPADSRVPTGGR